MILWLLILSFVSDGGSSSTAGGDDTNFWPNSPTRSVTPTSNVNIYQNPVGNAYQLYNQGGNGNNRYSPYRPRKCRHYLYNFLLMNLYEEDW